MIRGEAISYSSVPQDEGGRSGGDRTSIRTRPPASRGSRLNCQQTTVVLSLFVVAAISLAAILPLILMDSDAADGRGKIVWPAPAQEGGGGGESTAMAAEPVTPNSTAGYDAGHSSSSSGDGRPSTAQSVTNKVTQKSTPKPAIPTTTTTKTTTTTAAAATTTTTTTTTAIVTPKKPEVPSTTAAIPTAEEKPTSPAIPNMEGTTGDTQVVSPGAPKDNATKEDILNDIYDGSSAKPRKTITSWMNDMMADHDVPTLIALVVLVAVAVTVAVAAVVWLVHRRVSSRRRRIDIQSVITDLQSRDKVVLLNSEESEEE